MHWCFVCGKDSAFTLVSNVCRTCKEIVEHESSKKRARGVFEDAMCMVVPIKPKKKFVRKRLEQKPAKCVRYSS